MPFGLGAGLRNCSRSRGIRLHVLYSIYLSLEGVPKTYFFEGLSAYYQGSWGLRGGVHPALVSALQSRLLAWG